MLTSVSAFAPANGGNPAFFITRQSVFLVMGFIACVVASQVDYHWWIKYAWLWLLLGAVLMLLCFAPGIGVSRNGAHRWIDLGVTNAQPMEGFKFCLVVFMAYWLGRHQKYISSFLYGFAVPMAIVIAACGLAFLQNDFGSSFIFLSISLMMMFVGGTRLRYIIGLMGLGFSGIVVLVTMNSNRVARFLAFLDPEATQDGLGRQQWMGLIALGSGGPSGLGLGNSVQKMYYVPEPHTDFILSIIGEELGFFCAAGVVLLFVLLALSAGYISCHAPEPTGVLLGLGMTLMISMQASINMAVVTAMMPVTGLGLPFISYGGSNLIVCLVCIGVILNIHRQAIYESAPKRGVLPPVMRAEGGLHG